MTYDPRRWLSVSALKKVGDCARAYEIEKKEKLPARMAGWTVRGIALHEAIQKWEELGREPDPTAVFETAWDTTLANVLETHPDLSSWMRTPRVKTTERDLELRKADGLAQMTVYAERVLSEADRWFVRETEFPFKIELDDFIVLGYIDQIREWENGDLEIVDVKTSSNDEREDNRQLGVYRWGYRYETGIDVDSGLYWYTKLDRPSYVDLSPYTEEYLKGEFRKLDKIIAQKLFLPNPSIKNCKMCPVAQHCMESKQNG